MRSLLLTLLLTSCSNITMNSDKGASVTCDIYMQAPAKVSCVGSDGKSFVWNSDQALTLKGVCRPCADGSCPTCPAKP
jgi:hypothetical protein